MNSYKALAGWMESGGLIVTRAPRLEKFGEGLGTSTRWHLGHIEGIFRDLVSCTFLTKDFPENRVHLP